MSLRLYAPGKRKGNRHYIALGKINGKYYEITTGTRDKATAERLKADAEARIRASGQATSRLTFGEAIDRYIAYRDPGTDDLRRLNALKDAIGDRLVADIRQDDLTEAANKICPGFKNSSKNRNVIAPAASVLHYAAENEWCGYRRIKRFKEPKPETRAVTPQQASKLMEGTTGKVRLLYLWLFFQGNRVSEAIKIEGKNLDVKRGVGKAWINKTQSWRQFVLAPEVIAELKAQGFDEGKVFPYKNRWAVYRAIADSKRRAGIEFTPHMARHSLGTWLAAVGASQRSIQDALGHADMKSSSRYQAPETEAVRENLRKVGARVGKSREKRRKR